MKKSKKLAILVAVAFIAATISISVIPSYASTKTGKLTCGSNVATMNLTATNIAGASKTTSNNTAENLQAFIVTKKVNKNGTQISPDMDSSYNTNTKNSGTASVGITIGSGDRYKTVTSTHGAKFKGYSDKSANLSESF